MAEKTVTYHRSPSGKPLRTETTRYDNGASKSVTREQGTVISPGKLVQVQHSSPKKS